MIFIYLQYKPREIILSNLHLRDMQKTGFRGEILRQFQDLHTAQAYCEKKHPTYIKRLIKYRSKTRYYSPEVRERMREKKRGSNNPNFGGISEEHKHNIRVARLRLGIKRDLHWTWNIPRPPSTRRKISEGLRRVPRRRWALDEHGKERRIYEHEPLPEGWVYGRRRGRANAFKSFVISQ